jgi:hypothetical protein
MWPFSKTTDERFCFSIGKYLLNTELDTTDSVTELSESEYAVFAKKLKGEKIYHAPSVEFLNFDWQLMLGVVKGRIYKIVPFIETGDKQYANVVAMATLQYCMGLYGKPSKQETGLFIWDVVDGNVVLQTADAVDGFTINLFETSSHVYNFERI